MLNFHNLHLLPGDRVTVPKSGVGQVQHHAIYAGNSWFYENVMGKGVVFTHRSHFFKDVAKVTSIRRFTGNDYQRRLALNRAQKCLGESYHLINFNCEHFANYVQYGRSGSKQVENAIGLGAVALLMVVVARAAL